MSDDRLISSLRAFNVPTANRNITAINQPLADLRNLVVVVTQLKQGIDSLGGTRGGAYDRAVTFKDLSTLGLVSFKEVTTGSIPPQIGDQNGGPFLPLTGGTISGDLIVSGATALAIATATTPATANNSTSVATTAFVKAQGYIAGNQTITLSGDASGTGTTAIPVVLATVNANVGTFQGLTVDAKGRVTAAVNQGYLTTANAATTYAPLASPTLTGDPKAPTPLTADNDTSIATTAFVKAQGYIAGNQTITLSGDASGTGTTAIAVVLATVNANVGTFQGITVNAKGLVTAAANQNYATTAALAGYLPLTGGTISGTLGVGGAAQARLYVFGTTQATPAINTAGVLPYLMLDDSNTGVGAGGGIIFSAATGAWRFGAIVGYVTSGGSNSQGDIVFSTRRVPTDATLTEAMRIKSDGVALHKAPVICTSIGSPAIGQFHMAASAAGTGYGSFWYNDGTVTHLLLTANNDALGSYNSLRPFMVDSATGLVAIGHGVNITGLTQILSSSATNVLKIVNAGGQNLQIYDDTSEHIEASNVLWINGNTHATTYFGGPIVVQGISASTGTSAGFQFDDRGGVSPTQWSLVATGGKATLFNNVNGAVFSVGVAGALTTFGNVNGVNNKFFFWADTAGTLKLGFGLASDNKWWIGDGSRDIRMFGHVVPSTDTAYQCGYPGFAWYNVQSTLFNGSSDRRLKTDIEALPPDCLGLIRAIAPVRFRWRKGPNTDRQHWGFIAQDVKAAMDAAGVDFGGHSVGDDPDATQSLSVTDMIAVLWRAVQELAGRA